MAKEPKDPSAIIIPFGKHKGTTVAELLAKDPQYADWVTAQGWVAERFAELHAAIVTRGAGNDDTPEHNALQARFLDPEFRRAVLMLSVADKISEYRSSIMANELRSEIFARDNIIREWNHLVKKWEIPLNKLNRANEAIERIKEHSYPLHTKVMFEVAGVDAVIRWDFSSYDDRIFRSYPAKLTGIEIKPSVGDDYPTTLRQMKRLGASVLVIGQYNGRGVTEDQMIEIFNASGLIVVFVQDINDELRKSTHKLG